VRFRLAKRVPSRDMAIKSKWEAVLEMESGVKLS